jgi:transketolase
MKIELFSKKMRENILKMSFNAKTAHLASSLSCVDIVATLYNSILKITKKNIKKENRNYFILSKGHAATCLYSALFLRGILSKSEINNFAKKNSLLEEHPNPLVKGVEAATGSLGHGLSIGCGIALGTKIKRIKNKIFVLMSDGECNEGSTWEAALFASANSLKNLVAIIDYNKWQATGKTEDILKLGSLKKKFTNFGWNAVDINGHDFRQLSKNLNSKESSRPTAIIANTIKGKGVSFMEDDNNWHYRSPNEEELKKAIKEIYK